MLQSIKFFSIDVLGPVISAYTVTIGSYCYEFCYVWRNPNKAFHENNLILAASVAEARLGHAA